MRVDEDFRDWHQVYQPIFLGRPQTRLKRLYWGIMGLFGHTYMKHALSRRDEEAKDSLDHNEKIAESLFGLVLEHRKRICPECGCMTVDGKCPQCGK